VLAPPAVTLAPPAGTEPPAAIPPVPTPLIVAPPEALPPAVLPPSVLPPPMADEPPVVNPLDCSLPPLPLLEPPSWALPPCWATPPWLFVWPPLPEVLEPPALIVGGATVPDAESISLELEQASKANAAARDRMELMRVCVIPISMNCEIVVSRVWIGHGSGENLPGLAKRPSKSQLLTEGGSRSTVLVETASATGSPPSSRGYSPSVLASTQN
jgi:hypothetical protein